MTGPRPKILFLVNEDWFFLSHRLPVAKAARDAGATVFVMTRLNSHKQVLQEHGFELVPWRNFSRGSLNLVREFAAFLEVIRAFVKIRPDISYHVAIKPVVYGGFAARLLCVPHLSGITGLGSVYGSDTARMRLLRPLVTFLLRLALSDRESRVLFQNADNRDTLIGKKVVPAGTDVLVPGSGVDCNTYIPAPEKPGEVVVLLASRMLREKGVEDFVEAARRLRAEGLRARFVLAGALDAENPGRIAESTLISWNEDQIVEWWGYQTGMPAIFAQAHIVCLPSYGEGVPKALLEAAACGRPIITTDTPGCRDVVRHGENGLLIPPRDAEALANAIKQLFADPALRARMGARGREIAVSEFSEELVVRQTMEVYRELLGARWPHFCAAPTATQTSEQPISAQ